LDSPNVREDARGNASRTQLPAFPHVEGGTCVRVIVGSVAVA
jgi:hypothetical protein